MTYDTPPESATPSLIDEDARRRFEAAWRAGRPEPVEAFLPPPDDPRYLPTLEELILIEMELAWRARRRPASETSPGTPSPPLVEDYLQRFSLLDRPDVLRRLLEGECAARRRGGNEPSQHEYQSRFPTLDLTLLEPKRSSAGTLPAPPSIPGYEIRGLIGRGGMGVVYLAEQLNLKRLVALKMIRSAAHAGPEEIARFRAEAEAVAHLQHPNIVQIHEVGAHEDCPYLVLEYVEGGSLAQALNGKPQPPREAAVLVETLARAVQHAHERGVVHRDLKPANVLLARGTGGRLSHEPRVADFGLAKRLDQDAGQTQSGAVVGTPSYMAPEQAAGRSREVGPLVDVYALGAILYQCLTGRPPFAGATATETLGLVLTTEPVGLRRLQPGVPRDLETICLKCLEKEPPRRYGGAADLAADLGRFLCGEPIRARPVSVWRRAAKWARRRPALAGLLLVSVLAALALLLGGLWHNARLGAALARAEEARARARANYRLAREAVDSMLTRVSQERLAYVPRMEHARREILQDALTFYLRFLDDNRDDPEARHDTAQAYGRVGLINQLLGRHAEAEQAFANALELLNRLAADFPNRPEFRLGRVEQHNNLGLVRQATGRFAEAESNYRAALGVSEGLVAAFPGEPRHHRKLAAVRNNLAILLEAVGDFERAESAYGLALKAYESLHGAAPAERDYRREMGLIHNNLALLLATIGRTDEAVAHAARALALQDKLCAEAPRVPAYRQDLANTHLTRGHVLEATGHGPQAREAVRQSVALDRQLVQDFPGIPAYRHALVRGLVNLGALRLGDRDRGPARAALAEAIALGQQLFADCPDLAEAARDLAAARIDWAILRRAEGHRDEAVAACRAAQALLEKLTGGLSPLPDHRRSLATSHLHLARFHADAGDAERAARQALTLFRKLVEELPRVPAFRNQLADTWNLLGLLLRNQKRFREAEEALCSARDQCASLAGAFPRVAAYRQSLAGIHTNLANLLQATEALKQSEQEIRRAVELQEELVKAFPRTPTYRQELARSHGQHARLLSRTASLNTQKSVYVRALKLQEALVGEYPDEPAYRWELAATLNQLSLLFLKARVGPEMCSTLARSAVEHQRTGLKLAGRHPAQRRALRNYHLRLAEALLAQRRHAEVAQTVAELWALHPDEVKEYFVAAWFLARCVALGQGDLSLTAAKREEVSAGYARQAVELLRRAVARGFRDAAELRRNTGFETLQQREDFRALLRELEALRQDGAS